MTQGKFSELSTHIMPGECYEAMTPETSFKLYIKDSPGGGGVASRGVCLVTR